MDNPINEAEERKARRCLAAIFILWVILGNYFLDYTETGKNISAAMLNMQIHHSGR